MCLATCSGEWGSSHMLWEPTQRSLRLVTRPAGPQVRVTRGVSVAPRPSDPVRARIAEVAAAIKALMDPRNASPSDAAMGPSDTHPICAKVSAPQIAAGQMTSGEATSAKAGAVQIDAAKMIFAKVARAQVDTAPIAATKVATAKSGCVKTVTTHTNAAKMTSGEVPSPNVTSTSATTTTSSSSQGDRRNCGATHQDSGESHDHGFSQHQNAPLFKHQPRAHRRLPGVDLPRLGTRPTRSLSAQHSRSLALLIEIAPGLPVL
jgi:hypothetical protein